MNLDEDIIKRDLHDLLSHFSKQTYSASGCDERAERILDRCVDLFLKDYDISVLINRNGELCGHYPQKIIIVESELIRQENVLSDRSVKINDISQLKPLIAKSRFARCRSRFVVPVISFEGKNICRSATLSSFAEIFGRSGLDFLFSSPVFPEDDLDQENDNEWDLLNKSRSQDIQLLKALRVKYIFDLMLEKKKVKYGMRVTSSEKVDKENRYAEFSLCSVPYPGCEFFTVLKSQDHVSHEVHFDWNQDYVDADLSLPPEIELFTELNWERYQRWDLATLTQNYFLLLLKTIVNGDQGILVHCISGWDRTPLFVSLLRLSLWADGKVHQSLNALEILYLTIAYDWHLFGHALYDRMQRDEEVFFFCFDFLRYIMSDVYSTALISRSSSTIDLNDANNHQHIVNEGSPEHHDDEMLHSDNCSQPLETMTRDFFIGENQGQETVVTNNGTCSSRTQPFPSNQDSYFLRHNGTTPLPVPTNNSLNNQRDECHTQTCISGSWQIVSACADSLCGSTSCSVQPNLPRHFKRTHQNSFSSCEEVVEESVRRVRLETVRNIFLAVYREALCKETTSSNVTFSKLFDQVTDKLKNRWGKTT